MNQGTKEEIDAASKEAADENQTAAKSETNGEEKAGLTGTGEAQEPGPTAAGAATGTAASTGANEAQPAGVLVACIEVRKDGAKYFTKAYHGESVFPLHETEDFKDVLDFTEGFLRDKAAA